MGCDKPAGAAVLRAASVLQMLRKCRITHLVGLPDNSSARLFSLLDRRRAPRRVAVTREGEAFAVASGLWIGGARPAVLVQNTGLLESGDGLRGTALRMRIPLLCLVTYRGFAGLAGRPARAKDDPSDPECFSRADLDSAALVTEPTLKAWGLPYDFLHSDGDILKMDEAVRRAEKEMRPVALLVTRDMA